MQINSVGPNFAGVKVNVRQVKNLGKQALKGVQEALPEVNKIAKDFNVKITRGWTSDFIPYRDDALKIIAKQKGIFGAKVDNQMGYKDFSPENIVATVNNLVTRLTEQLADQAEVKLIVKTLKNQN